MSRLEALQPTVVKLVFTLQWLVFMLVALAQGIPSTGNQLLVASYPLVLFYLVAVALELLSKHTQQIAKGWRLLVLALSLAGVDQLGKAAIVAYIPYRTSVPIVAGWLHMAHIQNAHGSWLLSNLQAQGLGTVVLAIAAASVLLFSIFCHRYYVTTQRKSVWADVAFAGLFAGCLSWMCDMSLRGYVVDFIRLPGVLTADLKDLFLDISAAALLAEALDNPRVSLRPKGLRQDSRELLQLGARVAAFSTRELRSFWRAWMRQLGKGPRASE